MAAIARLVDLDLRHDLFTIQRRSQAAASDMPIINLEADDLYLPMPKPSDSTPSSEIAEAPTSTNIKELPITSDLVQAQRASETVHVPSSSEIEGSSTPEDSPELRNVAFKLLQPIDLPLDEEFAEDDQFLDDEELSRETDSDDVQIASYESPVYRLPIELMQLIFTFVCAGIELTLSPDVMDSAPFLLVQVCHDWRVIALGLPSLWSKIRFKTHAHYIPTSIDIMDLILDRCGSSKLQLRFEDYHSNPQQSGDLPTETAFDDRMSHLQINTCAPRFRNSTLLNRWIRLSELEELILNLSDCECMIEEDLNDFSLDDLALSTTHLKRLSIQNAWIGSVRGDLSNLQELSLSYYNTDGWRTATLSLFELLLQTPALRSLSIEGSGYLESDLTRDDPQRQLTSNIDLPVLHSLTVRGDKDTFWWLPILHTPELVDMDFGLYTRWNSDPVEYIQRMRPLPHVTQLKLHEWVPGLAPLFQNVVRNVKALTIKNDDWQRGFVREARWRQVDGSAIVLSSLEEVNLAVRVERAQFALLAAASHIAHRLAREASFIAPNLRAINILPDRGTVVLQSFEPLVRVPVGSG